MGNVIQKLRCEQGWSQPKLARLMKVSLTTIKNWELDSSDPSAKHIWQLMSVFKVSADYLFGIKSNEPDYISQLPPHEQYRAKRLISAYNRIILDELKK